MFANTYVEKWNLVPDAVKQFLLRALIILIAWKILYLAFLLPTRVFDKPLSHSVAGTAAAMLNTFTNSKDYSAKSENGDTDDGLTNVPLDNIYFHQKTIVSIEDGCNGLELFVLYAGFIICMPAVMSRKVLFVIAGILIIHVVNILRCAGITYIILYDPKHADFAHHYIFTFVVYGLIIGLWLAFSQRLSIKNAETE